MLIRLVLLALFVASSAMAQLASLPAPPRGGSNNDILLVYDRADGAARGYPGAYRFREFDTLCLVTGTTGNPYGVAYNAEANLLRALARSPLADATVMSIAQCGGADAVGATAPLLVGYRRAIGELLATMARDAQVAGLLAGNRRQLAVTVLIPDPEPPPPPLPREPELSPMAENAGPGGVAPTSAPPTHRMRLSVVTPPPAQPISANEAERMSGLARPENMAQRWTAGDMTAVQGCWSFERGFLPLPIGTYAGRPRVGNLRTVRICFDPRGTGVHELEYRLSDGDAGICRAVLAVTLAGASLNIRYLPQDCGQFAIAPAGYVLTCARGDRAMSCRAPDDPQADNLRPFR